MSIGNQEKDFAGSGTRLTEWNVIEFVILKN